MNNPINLTVFDSRDLVEYKEYLEEELTNDWNDWQEEHLNDEFKADDAEEVAVRRIEHAELQRG